jgi:hypothetical protein
MNEIDHDVPPVSIVRRMSQLTSMLKISTRTAACLSDRLRVSYVFLILLIANLFCGLRDRSEPHFLGVSLTATATQASKAWGWSDAGSYLQMALSIAKTGGISENLRWTLAFWPPGQSYIETLALKVMGVEGQFILFLLVLNAVLFALLLSLVWRFFRRCLKGLPALLAILPIYLFPLVHNYLLRDSVIWSDGWAALFLSFSVVLALNAAIAASPISWILCSGMSFGIAVYIRGQYFAVIQLALLVTIASGVLKLLARLIPRASQQSPPLDVAQTSFHRPFRQLLAWTLSVLMTCAPYVFWRASNIGDIPWDTSGRISWTSTEAFAMMGNWIPSEKQVAFIREGGGGTACVIDPNQCREILKLEYADPTPFSIYDSEPFSAREYKKFTIQTFLRNPLEWSGHKIPVLWRYWFSEPTVSSPGGNDPIASSLSLAGLLVMFSLGCTPRFRKRFGVTGVVILLCLVGTFAPPFLAHFEVRYLIWPKLLGLISIFFSMAFLLRRLFWRIGDLTKRSDLYSW